MLAECWREHFWAFVDLTFSWQAAVQPLQILFLLVLSLNFVNLAVSSHLVKRWPFYRCPGIGWAALLWGQPQAHLTCTFPILKALDSQCSQHVHMASHCHYWATLRMPLVGLVLLVPLRAWFGLWEYIVCPAFFHVGTCGPITEWCQLESGAPYRLCRCFGGCPDILHLFKGSVPCLKQL